MAGYASYEISPGRKRKVKGILDRIQRERRLKAALNAYVMWKRTQIDPSHKNYSNEGASVALKRMEEAKGELPKKDFDKYKQSTAAIDYSFPVPPRVAQ